MVAVPNTTGETLFQVVKDVLIRLDLPIRNCRGQAYDGESNIQGNIKGVATRIQEEEPSAIHFHCLAHCLNICFQDITRQYQPVRDVRDFVNEILKLIRASPKRSQLFNNMKLETSPETLTLRKLCPTRWTMRTASIDSILKNYIYSTYGYLGRRQCRKRRACRESWWFSGSNRKVINLLWYETFSYTFCCLRAIVSHFAK